MISKYKTLLKENEHATLIVHYSCSSIRKIPCKISCIGIRDEGRNENWIFSLREFSEKEMLEKAWKIIAKNKDKYFVGWNIKNPEYGFAVLKQRYEEILRKKAPKIRTSHVVDLDEAIKRDFDLKRQKLTLRRVAEINGYQTLDFRNGKEELKLFEERDFKGLELSVGRKIRIIGDILNDFIRGKLKIEPELERKLWSAKKIIGSVAYISICIAIDLILLPAIGVYSIGLIGAEATVLFGLPKLVEWLRNKPK